jgi:glycerol-3-phosphate dehydrogenase
MRGSMVRDLRRLADTAFDVVIVGAGIYGAIAAWDAVLRGLSVALIDKDDFGSGTSFNNLKTLHGGLRSLQALNFKQMRLFIRERRAFARIAPHLVQPLPFIVPTYHNPRRSALVMRLALAINDIVSRDRHRGINDPSLRLPAGRLVGREECLQLDPVVDTKGVTGGAVWYDYQLHNPDRMTFSFIRSAADGGAAVANYLRAVNFIRDGDRVAGVRVEDRLTSEQFDLRGTVVLNAAGPWAPALLHTLQGKVSLPAARLSRAMNVVTRSTIGTHACGGPAGGRFLFMVPWRHVAVVGTGHEAHEGTADALSISRWDLEAFLADARAAFPHAPLSASEVQLVHRGFLPMVSGTDTHVKLLRESAVVDHRKDKLPGLVTIFGVRYTTARHTAARAVNAVFRARGDGTFPASRTAETPVAGGTVSNKENFLRAILLRDVEGVSPETLRRLASTYGTQYDEVLQIVRDRSVFGEPLGRHCTVTGAEILHAVRNECAVKLSDALIRRTEAGSAGHPGSDAVEHAATIMARLLGWDEWKVRNEVAEVEAFYRLPV